MSNGFRRTYIGVTSNLMRRVFQHKNPEPDSTAFTARYNMTRLVYVEHFPDMGAAIAREKQLKGWTRARKLELIMQSNPTWLDLSEEWGKPIELYQWQ